MKVRNIVFFFVVCVVIVLLTGCSVDSPSRSKKIAMQENATQRAHQEMEQSLHSEDGNNKQEIDSDKSASPSIDNTSSQEMPSWVTSPPSSDSYIYGVGSAQIHADPASAMSRAKDQARTEILKQIEVTVAGKTKTSVSREVKDGKSHVTRSIMDQVQTKVSETKLSHVELVNTHEDKRNDTVYALLRLDKEAAKAELESRLKDIDSRLREISASKADGSRLKQLETLVPALPLFEKRRQVRERLSSFSEKDTDYRLSADLRDLQDRIASLLDSLVLVLRPQNNKSEKLTSGLRKELSKQGLRIRLNGRGDIILRYAIDLRSMERDGVQYVFAQGNITVLNSEGKVLNEFTDKAKGASQDLGLARDKAVTMLAESLGKKLAESLLKSFELKFAGR